MPFELSPEAQAKLAARQQRYIDSLRGKRVSLEALAAPLIDGDASGASRDPLREAVHKMAGSAGLYGLTELQQRAAELDAALLNYEAAPVSSARLRELIAALFAAFDSEPG